MRNSGFFDKIIGSLPPCDRSGVEAFVKRIEKERALLETIFNSIQEGIVVLDGEGRVKYVNQAAVDLLGLPENVEGSAIFRLVRGVDWSSVVGEEGEWRKTARSEVEILYPEKRNLLVYIVPLDKDRNDAAVILTDITESKNRSLEELEEERVNAISLLAAGVAHEIGNPLNSLDIHLQLLERTLDSSQSEALELLKVARQEVARLDQVTSQFLQAVRSVKPAMIETDIKPLVIDTVKTLQAEIEEKQVKVKCEWPGHIPKIAGDPTQLRQAFLNLLKNAIQATPIDGEIKIECRSDNDTVSISFQDTGHGISQKNMSKVLTPYFSTKKGGTGLGLMVVERIVNAHGGKILVESEEHHGAKFTLQFPRASRRVRLLQPPPEEYSEKK